MHDINLIPHGVLNRKKSIFKSSLRVLLAMLIIAIVALLVLIMPYQRYQLEEKVRSMTSKIDQGSLNEINAAQAALMKIAKEKSSIEDLYRLIPSQGIAITNIYSKVSKAALKLVDINGMKYNWAQQAMELSCIAKTRPDISVFLKRLHDDSLFKGINISQITKSGNGYNFTLLLDF